MANPKVFPQSGLIAVRYYQKNLKNLAKENRKNKYWYSKIVWFAGWGDQGQNIQFDGADLEDIGKAKWRLKILIFEKNLLGFP